MGGLLGSHSYGAWRAGLAAALACVGVYFVLPTTAQEFVYPAFGLASVAVIVIGVRRHGAPQVPWFLIAAGQLLFVGGDLAFLAYDFSGGEAPFPSIADALYAGGYPCFLLAMWAFLRRCYPGRDRTSLLDASIASVAMALLIWTFSLAPYVYVPGLTWLERTIAVAYPLTDVVLLGLVVQLLAARALRIPSLLMLAVGIATLLVGDVIYAGAALADAYDTGHAADAGWLLSYVLIAAGAAHRSSSLNHRPAHAPLPATSKRRFGLLIAASFLPPALLAVQEMRGQDLQLAALMGASLVIYTLVMLRMAYLIQDVQNKNVELDRQGKLLQDSLDQRRILEEALRHRAFHDSLTDLPNRALFTDRVTAALARRKRADTDVALVLVDLDDFKIVNDTRGHSAGDYLLIHVARRLLRCLREADTAARFGGDEFAVVLEGVQGRAETRVVAQRVIAAFQVPFDLPEGELRIGASVGVALATDKDDVESLLHKADVAMYQAKAKSKNCVVFWSARAAKTRPANAAGGALSSEPVTGS